MNNKLIDNIEKILLRYDQGGLPEPYIPQILDVVCHEIRLLKHSLDKEPARTDWEAGYDKALKDVIHLLSNKENPND